MEPESDKHTLTKWIYIYITQTNSKLVLLVVDTGLHHNIRIQLNKQKKNTENTKNR